MTYSEITIHLLEKFRDKNMWKEGFMALEDRPEIRKNICERAIETIKEQQEKIKQLTELSTKHETARERWLREQAEDEEICKHCERDCHICGIRNKDGEYDG